MKESSQNFLWFLFFATIIVLALAVIGPKIGLLG